MMEAHRKLEAGLVGQKRERHVPTSEQLTMDVVSMLVHAPTDEAIPTPSTTVEKHERAKPTASRRPRSITLQDRACSLDSTNLQWCAKEACLSSAKAKR
jgi:hypothetical protein